MHTSDVQLTPLFQTVPRRRRAEVAQAADRLTVSAGSTLIRQGELAHEFFVIVDGIASVICDGRPVRTLGPGDFFGEIGLVGKPYRTATVIADSDLDVLVMGRREFRTILSRFPDVASVVLGAGRMRVVASLREVQARL
jgi:CRP/FNR family cyclic AMP-dependent transcriptional regulator